jgi:hypothetical protein
MIIHLYSTMRNEEKIIPYFFRHYDKFIDQYYISEDHSTDRTLELLKAHPKVTLQPIGYDGIDEFIIAKWYSETYKTHSRGIADWVICADADEFIYHVDIIERLKNLQVDGVQVVLCAGRQMLADHFPATDGQIYDEIKEGIIDSDYSKCILFQPCIDINFSPGRHWNGPDSYAHRPRITPNAVIFDKEDILNLHYACLGIEYLRERHAKNAARQSDDNIKNRFGINVQADNHGKCSNSYFEKIIPERKVIL